jgi:hypothetical protein
MTHAGTTHLLPLPGAGVAGVYDPTMPECLISVAQLLETGYHIIFRIPQVCVIGEFDKFTYPHYGGFITIPHKEYVSIFSEKEQRAFQIQAVHKPH